MVHRRAKIIIIDLDSAWFGSSFENDWSDGVCWQSNSGLPGHPNDSLVGDLPDKSTRIIFEFTSGINYSSNDQRKFGLGQVSPRLMMLQVLPNIAKAWAGP